MIENNLSNKIIGCAIEVHKQLGPGLLESAYQECLYYELNQAGFLVGKEIPMPVVYKEVKSITGTEWTYWSKTRWSLKSKLLRHLRMYTPHRF